MLTLVDGPCAGTFMVKRAPLFLRAVLKAQLDGTGETDVLDQIDDTPTANEKVYVYKMEGQASAIHINASGKGGKDLTGFWAMANYRYLPDVDGEQLRDNEKWQSWILKQIG